VSDLIAIDVAILPPEPVSRLAKEVSARLPADNDERLVLDDHHLPHITLTQQFVRVEELDLVMRDIDTVLQTVAPMPLHVRGGGVSGHTVWMEIERSTDLAALHESLMEALRGVERPGGTPAAFADGDARVRDLVWVSGYRLKSSFHAYTPHITLGHGAEPPHIEPFDFVADTIAICQLGRFCACRRALRSWTLAARHDTTNR
jgi:2'-5' RNA ligase